MTTPTLTVGEFAHNRLEELLDAELQQAVGDGDSSTLAMHAPRAIRAVATEITVCYGIPFPLSMRDADEAFSTVLASWGIH